MAGGEGQSRGEKEIYGEMEGVRERKKASQAPDGRGKSLYSCWWV